VRSGVVTGGWAGPDGDRWESRREDDRLRVLLVDDDEEDHLIARDLLDQALDGRFTLDWVAAYAAGRDQLLQGVYDVCLLDHHLGAGTGLELLREIVAQGCRTPVLLPTGQGDRDTDLAAMRSGAADYLVKGELTAPILERAIRYARERQRLLEQIRTLSLVDELTGLYNRRGFFTMAEPQVKLTRRARRRLLLLFADLDGMKQINDRYGHKAGDEALAATAALLRQTFRGTDVIARFGGDEFVVLAPGADANVAAMLLDRLHASVAAHNAAQTCDEVALPIALSAGFVCVDPGDGRTLDAWLAEADAAMYEQKEARKRARGLSPGGGTRRAR